MGALLDAFTWWPWTADHGPIRNVERKPEAPGLVTLTWRTLEPTATLLARTDGTELYRDDAPRTSHRVTLTGISGFVENIDILAEGGHSTIEIRF